MAIFFKEVCSAHIRKSVAYENVYDDMYLWRNSTLYFFFRAIFILHREDPKQEIHKKMKAFENLIKNHVIAVRECGLDENCSHDQVLFKKIQKIVPKLFYR